MYGYVEAQEDVRIQGKSTKKGIFLSAVHIYYIQINFTPLAGKSQEKNIRFIFPFVFSNGAANPPADYEAGAATYPISDR